MDKREHHQQQKMKQIYLTAQKAALAARLMALKHKIKNQNDGEEIQESIRYVKLKLEYSAYSQFKIGHCKIESERWVRPEDRPFQYFMPMGKHDKEMELEDTSTINNANLPKSTHIDQVPETSMNLPFRPYPRSLPAELNREIFYCFKLPTRHKFICGLGWGFYAMFRQILLKKTKRIRNPHMNGWNGANTRATVSADGLNVRNNIVRLPKVFAEQAFPISGQCRVDGFPGTILYYYEIKGDRFYAGLSDGAIPDNSWHGEYLNSYAIRTAIFCLHLCWLVGETHHFELPEGAIRPRKEEVVNVYGCGLVLDTEDKLWIFFTLNGQLLGQKIPINPTVNCLFPTVALWDESSFETNFGDDPTKPFIYDIQNCPGLGLACI